MSWGEEVTTYKHSCVVILEHGFADPTLETDIVNVKLGPLIRYIHSKRLSFTLANYQEGWEFGGGGALTCQRYTGMCRFDDPLFRLLLHFSFFKKKKIAFLGPFLSDFGQISAPNTLILAKICSQDPSFLRKNSVL